MNDEDRGHFPGALVLCRLWSMSVLSAVHAELEREVMLQRAAMFLPFATFA
jgi:hypothetical protein